MCSKWEFFVVWKGWSNIIKKPAQAQVSVQGGMLRRCTRAAGRCLLCTCKCKLRTFCSALPKPVTAISARGWGDLSLVEVDALVLEARSIPFLYLLLHRERFWSRWWTFLSKPGSLIHLQRVSFHRVGSGNLYVLGAARRLPFFSPSPICCCTGLC